MALGSASLILAGCATVPERPYIVRTGDPVIDGNAELNAAPKKDKVMWDYRIAGAAIRRGQFDEAKAKLDDAILAMGGILANAADARRARSLFSSESTKTFIGEPYERCMAYYYRGILYWHDGQPDNARACFRSAALIDSDPDGEYRSDFVLFDYLAGLATLKLSGDGSDSLALAIKNARGVTPPKYDRSANVLIFAEYGKGPRKFQGGQYDEQLRFAVQDSPAHSAVLSVNGQKVALPPYDDLNYQATTRGGRVMDHILGNKAVFKNTTGTVGDVAIVGAAVAANSLYHSDGSYNRDAQNAAIILGAVGILSKIASAATKTEADIRQWDNLPQRLSFAAVKLPPGDYTGTVEYFDASGGALPQLTQQVPIHVDEPSNDTVIFLSEHNR